MRCDTGASGSAGSSVELARARRGTRYATGESSVKGAPRHAHSAGLAAPPSLGIHLTEASRRRVFGRSKEKGLARTLGLLASSPRTSGDPSAAGRRRAEFCRLGTSLTGRLPPRRYSRSYQPAAAGTAPTHRHGCPGCGVEHRGGRCPFHFRGQLDDPDDALGGDRGSSHRQQSCTGRRRELGSAALRALTARY